MTEFTQIPSHPNYFINCIGDVKSVNRFGVRILKRLRVKSGYQCYNLWTNGKYHTKYIHHLVLETFVGPKPDGLQCRHLDGNRDNNSISNLVWGTPKENSLDRVLHGTDYMTNRWH